MEQKLKSSAQNEATDVALGRSYLYQWLSRMFRYPDAELMANLQEPALTQLEATLDRLVADERECVHHALARLRATSTGLGLTQLQSEHRQVFGHIESSPCPPYETRYCGRHLFQQTYQLSDIAGFYRAFGLDISDDADERPDYLAIELEFLHFLCFKEAYALEQHGPEQIELTRDAEVKFLRDHLLPWAPSFARRLQDQAGDGLYRQLATVMLAFLGAEAGRFRCSPAREDALQPIEHLPERCSFSCGLGTQDGDDLIGQR